MAFPVETVQMRPQAAEYPVFAVGSVEAFEKVQVTSRVAGVIEKIRFVEGQSVKSQQVLAEIEPQRFKLAVRAAEATLAKTEVAEAEAGLSRRESVEKANPGLIRGGELIPLSSLITREEKPVLQAITRKDRERAISFYANVAAGHSQGEVLAEVEVEKMSGELPAGYRVVLGGASVAFRESTGSLYFALVMGILVAYMVLASQFNSFLHPVTVLTILPLSVAGAALALWATGTTSNLFSLIGLLFLLGIVKKNSIILVDYALQLRESGKSAVEAMLEAGPTRLRPIVMTSVATMMAAIPSALALGAGAEIKRPMAIAVLGGMVLSTVLSLAVVPAFYVLTQRRRPQRDAQPLTAN